MNRQMPTKSSKCAMRLRRNKGSGSSGKPGRSDETCCLCSNPLAGPCDRCLRINNVVCPRRSCSRCERVVHLHCYDRAIRLKSTLPGRCTLC